jgi:hypothetical protein
MWDNCLRPSLDAGVNAKINYIALIKGEEPAAEDIERAILSSLAFKEELAGYIESYQESSEFYTKPQRFININPGSKKAANKLVMKEFKKETKSFKKGGKEPKVIIDIIYNAAPSADRAGNIAISVK